MNHDNTVEAVEQRISRVRDLEPSTNIGWQHDCGDKVPAKFNAHIYENLLVHVEQQIESWNRKAIRDPNPVTAHALWLKAEGLGYALRLLYAFEPEFREVIECAARCEGVNLTVPTSQNLERKSV